MHLTLWIFLALIPSITSLKCYDCNELEDGNCASGETLTQNYLKNCDPPAHDSTAALYCRKIDQTVNGKKSVVRSCGAYKGNKDCYKTAGVNSASVCSCNDRDGCNTASSLHQNHIITLLSSILILAITMIYIR